MNNTILFCITILCITFSQMANAGVAKAGFAERDITPKMGIKRPGVYRKRLHTSIHDPCKVRAAVFDDGKKKVVLVSVDALVFRRPQVLAARKLIHQETGIKKNAILISATHSHSSGPTFTILDGEYDHADELVQELAYTHSLRADPAYLKHVINQLVEAVVTANSSLTPVEMGFASGKEGKVSFNRRFKMKNGLSYTNPRQGNPGIINPAGPIDPEVGVIAVWSDRKKERSEDALLGCIINFACHPTANPPGISANYIYYLEKEIRSIMGEESIVVFLGGASGDINIFDTQSPHQLSYGRAAGKLVGGQVGAAACSVMLKMGSTKKLTLDFKQKILNIPRRKPTPEKVGQARKIAGNLKQITLNPTLWQFSKETVLLDALIQKNPIREVEIQAIQIGPTVFLATPSELFCQYGLNQKKESPFPLTYVVSLANGCVGYVPTEEAFGKNGGGYETRLTAYSNLIPSAGRLMTDAGIALAKEMKPTAIPPRPSAAKFKEAWNYGAVPPELK